MEVNITENELDYFTSSYKKAKKELYDVKENIEEKLLEQNDNELNHDYVNNEVMRYDKLVDDKKGEIYHSKKFYMENCSRKRGFKLFLLLIVSNYLAHFFPGLIVPIAALSLGIFLVDVIFLSKKHYNDYAKKYYESKEYEELKSDLDRLKTEYEKCLNELNNIEFDIMHCEHEIDDLNRRRNELENKIENLKSDLFNKVVGICEELEKPIELKRK